MTAAETSTVLVVDDDKNVCSLISAALALQGYKTVEAFNGREALEYLKRSGDHPGLILLDLMMPVMTGWEFRNHQQSDPAIADIPVAIITGLPDVDGKGREIGAVDVLYKPSKVETLTALVSRFCKL
jgi:CheY-like chemotaxis protein